MADVTKRNPAEKITKRWRLFKINLTHLNLYEKKKNIYAKFSDRGSLFQLGMIGIFFYIWLEIILKKWFEF